MTKFSKILQKLWRVSEGQLVYLPIRDGNTWHEPDGLSPEIAVEVVNWMLDIQTPQQLDYYFTPLKYFGRRQRDKVGRPGVIFADMDEGTVPTTIPPSLLIESSPGHMHGYWFLNDTIALADWEPKAKEWSRQLGADPGGWDATQVLRLPGTPNMKYEKVKVQLLEWDPSLVYSLSDFPEPRVAPLPELASAMPIVDPMNRLNHVRDNWEKLPLSSQHYLTMTHREYIQSGMVDRSVMIWGVIQTLLESGLGPVTIFAMMHGAPWDKYITRPTTLWNTITKASSLYQNQIPIVV